MPSEAEDRALQEQINNIDRLSAQIDDQAIRDKLLQIKQGLAAIKRGEHA